MDAGIIVLLIQVAAGLIGGTVIGSRIKNATLGGLGNALAGAVGGIGGGQILGALVPELSGTESMDFGTIIGQVVGSGAGGALLTIAGALIKNALAGR